MAERDARLILDLGLHAQDRVQWLHVNRRGLAVREDAHADGHFSRQFIPGRLHGILRIWRLRDLLLFRGEDADDRSYRFPLHQRVNQARPVLQCVRDRGVLKVFSNLQRCHASKVASRESRLCVGAATHKNINALLAVTCRRFYQRCESVHFSSSVHIGLAVHQHLQRRRIVDIHRPHDRRGAAIQIWITIVDVGAVRDERLHLLQ
mmetsp:Transcript_54318/g.107881  ORF Transcript_54318/g.107881 Transcript_54318/m.107881 type:complete len:206 (-) Transcript_54318:132-749(-)